ncbi:hypothetical protein C8Q76DRAFT_109489 [Earliella scabrosa]|nr:hypothetical protein C8Q76DRAFT_109489 [Earliella scabrosa]
MAYCLGFHRTRTWVFVIATFVSLVWTALLSAEIFVLYDRSDRAQRNLVGVMIFVNAVTAVMPLVLLLVEFRVWLDGARMAFLLVAHFGTALLFALFNPTFVCPAEPSQRKLCRDVNLAILVCSWVLPALFVWYSAFLAVMHYKKLTDVAPAREAREKHLSTDLPIMNPASRRPSTVPSVYSAASARRTQTVSQGPPPPMPQWPPPNLPGTGSASHSAFRQASLAQERQPQSRPYHNHTPFTPERQGSRPVISQPTAMQQRPPSLRPFILQPPPTQASWRPMSSQQQMQMPPKAFTYPPSQRSIQRSSVSQQSHQRRISQPLSLSIPSAYSQRTSQDSRRTSAQPSRPASQLPSPSTPQSSSRSASSRVMSKELVLSPIAEVDNSSPNSKSSERSSGRLSKPSPLLPYL